MRQGALALTFSMGLHRARNPPRVSRLQRIKNCQMFFDCLNRILGQRDWHLRVYQPNFDFIRMICALQGLVVQRANCLTMQRAIQPLPSAMKQVTFIFVAVATSRCFCVGECRFL